jgi:hypothetical protein
VSAPRRAPSLRACGRCGAQRFLRVAPVREHGEGGAPVAMAVRYVDRPRELGPLARAVSCVGPKIVPVPEGSFTVLICTGCGDTRFYARDLPASEGDAATLGACGDCGEPRALHVPRVKTRGHGGQPSDLRVLRETTRRWGFSTHASAGHFSLFVCRGCARASFVAGGLDAIPALHKKAAPSAPCRRCAATLRLAVEPVDEDGATLRVLYDRVLLREVRIGTYALDICIGCGLTDWTARDTEALRPDLRTGVALVEADGSHEGPYR